MCIPTWSPKAEQLRSWLAEGKVTRSNGKVHILSDSEKSALAARVEEIEKTHGQQAAVDWQSRPRRLAKGY